MQVTEIIGSITQGIKGLIQQIERGFIFSILVLAIRLWTGKRKLKERNDKNDVRLNPES